MKKIVATLSSFMLLLAATAHAQLELQPQVAFSASRVISVSGVDQAMEGPYYYSPGRHRSEMNAQGQSFTAIIREDRNLIWMLMPQLNMYMELSFDDRELGRGGAFEGAEVLQSRELGREDINGMRTTRYEVTVRNPDGDSATGTVWATAENIPMKMDMVVDSGERVVLELRDVRIGPQPDELFEVPAGYTGMSLGSIGSITNALQGAFGGAAEAGQAGASGADQDDPGFAREVAEGAAEGARDAVSDGVRDGVRENVGRRIRGIFNR